MLATIEQPNSVEELYIVFSSVTDKGLECLNYFPRLHTLVLRTDNITELGLENVLNLINLKRLVVRSDDVAEDAALAVLEVAARPVDLVLHLARRPRRTEQAVHFWHREGEPVVVRDLRLPEPRGQAEFGAPFRADEPVRALEVEERRAAAGESFVALDENPTAEYLARTIYDHLKSKGLPILAVRFWETDTSVASYEE